jgi:hypothetical protein
MVKLILRCPLDVLMYFLLSEKHLPSDLKRPVEIEIKHVLIVTDAPAE